MVIRRKKRSYLIPKLKKRRGLFVKKKGVQVKSGCFGSGAYFQGMEEENIGTVLKTKKTQRYEKRHICLRDLSNGEFYQADFHRSLVIGRNENRKEEQPILVIMDSSISGKHCRFFLYENFLYVEDLGSTNKTCLNGVKIDTAVLVQNKDILKLGRKQFQVEFFESC